jgi:hypothetical protein
MRHTLGLQDRAAERFDGLSSRAQRTTMPLAGSSRHRCAHQVIIRTRSSQSRRARRRDERYHYQHELADVRQRQRAEDQIQSIPTRPPSGAVRGHFLLAQPSLRSAALVVLSLMHRWRERLDGKTKRLARSRLAVCSRPRASTTLKTRETSAGGGNQARAEVGAGQGPERLDLGCRAFRLPFQALLDEQKSRTPHTEGIFGLAVC